VAIRVEGERVKPCYRDHRARVPHARAFAPSPLWKLVRKQLHEVVCGHIVNVIR
jgi:hypothetical protein